MYKGARFTCCCDQGGSATQVAGHCKVQVQPKSCLDPALPFRLPSPMFSSSFTLHPEKILQGQKNGLGGCGNLAEWCWVSLPQQEPAGHLVCVLKYQIPTLILRVITDAKRLVLGWKALGACTALVLWVGTGSAPPTPPPPFSPADFTLSKLQK